MNVTSRQGLPVAQKIQPVPPVGFGSRDTVSHPDLEGKHVAVGLSQGHHRFGTQYDLKLATVTAIEPHQGLPGADKENPYILQKHPISDSIPAEYDHVDRVTLSFDSGDTLTLNYGTFAWDEHSPYLHRAHRTSGNGLSSYHDFVMSGERDVTILTTPDAVAQWVTPLFKKTKAALETANLYKLIVQRMSAPEHPPEQTTLPDSPTTTAQQAEGLTAMTDYFQSLQTLRTQAQTDIQTTKPVVNALIEKTAKAAGEALAQIPDFQHKVAAR